MITSQYLAAFAIFAETRTDETITKKDKVTKFETNTRTITKRTKSLSQRPIQGRLQKRTKSKS